MKGLAQPCAISRWNSISSLWNSRVSNSLSGRESSVSMPWRKAAALTPSSWKPGTRMAAGSSSSRYSKLAAIDCGLSGRGRKIHD